MKWHELYFNQIAHLSNSRESLCTSIAKFALQTATDQCRIKSFLSKSANERNSWKNCYNPSATTLCRRGIPPPHFPLNTSALHTQMGWNGTTAFCLAGTGLTLWYTLITSRYQTLSGKEISSKQEETQHCWESPIKYNRTWRYGSVFSSGIQ